MNLYEQKYKEALKKIRELIERGKEKGWTITTYEKDFEEIFPELAESEDERIRKELIKETKGSEERLFETVTNEEFIAWLEKQGQVKESNISQHENKTRKENDDSLTDDVEQKFKIGDWICSPLLGTARIIGVNDSNYQLEYIDGKQKFSSIDYVNYAYDKWTIKDAKYGDVLIASDGSIFIFKEVIDSGCKHYIALEVEDGTIQVNDNSAYCWESVFGVCPATKEQRDTLFAKMTDAGWEFDFTKKELKKIEDEEYNGKDYGIDSLWNAKNILEKTLGKVDGYQSDDGILEHKCAITAVKKLYEQKHVWSEEDEEILRTIISDGIRGAGFDMVQVNWLKSMKERYTWKPSDEQMDALLYISRDYTPKATNKLAGESRQTLELMLEQLKKLRED